MKSVLSIVLAFSLLLAGCTAGNSVMPPEPMGFPSPEAALSAIKPDRNGEGVFQVTAKVTFSAPRGKIILKLATVIQPPDKLRLETIPVLGPPDFFMTVRKGRFKVFLPGTPEFITGNASPDNLGRFLPLAWPVERWVSVLTGTHPETMGQAVKIRGMMEGPLYRIDMMSGKTIRESFWVNPQNQHLEKANFISDDGQQYQVTYQWGLQSDSTEIPEIIKIELEGETRILITCSDLQTVKNAGPDLFDLPSPGEDIPVRNLD